MQAIGAALAAATQQGIMPQPRLVKAAHEFEAQLMKELLRPMTSGDALTGEEEDSGGGGVLGEFASEALGRSLSEQGGLGIANSIVKSLSHSGNASQFAPALGNPAADFAGKNHK